MPRRVLEGIVVSDKANKTITVRVERRYRHPVYKKYLRSSDKYAAHDEHNQFKIGDRVQIIECRPISKSKSWTVVTDGSTPAPRKEETKAAPKAAKKEAAPKAEKPKKEAAKKPAAKKDKNK
jgi:small subunit ribosomal protein S17